MSHYRLGTYAAGLAAIKSIDDIVVAEPYPITYLEYTEVVDVDNLGIPIEAGLPRASWHWDWLPQADLEALATLCPGASVAVYVRTRQNIGVRYQYQIFTATMLRPRVGDMIQSEAGEPYYPQRRGPVDIDFINLVVVP